MGPTINASDDNVLSLPKVVLFAELACGPRHVAALAGELAWNVGRVDGEVN